VRNLFAGRREKLTDVVFLLPGFMGYDHISDYQYFADRVAATVRTALWFELGRDVPVVPLATRPTAPLARRQRFLRARLARYLTPRGRHASAPRVHLVGHSTGGLDAWLLACRRPLVDSEHGTARFGRENEWPQEFRGHVRGRVASVVTISAPFWGAALAGTSGARLLAGQPHGPRDVGAGLLLVTRALGAAAIDRARRRSGLDDVIVNGLVDGRAVGTLALDVLRDRGLVLDLVPQHMARLMEEAEPELASVHCFASVAPPPPGRPADGSASPERHRARLFELLYREIEAVGGDVLAPQVDEGLARLASAPALGHCDALSGPLTRTSNDGLVNTAAMVAPLRSGQEVCATLVVGDHGDVVGHYDRPRDPRETDRERWALESFLASGAGFDDDTFYALYRGVAAAIAGRSATAPGRAASDRCGKTAPGLGGSAEPARE